MTWKEFFEKAQQEKRDVTYGNTSFSIASVEDEFVQLGEGEHREYVSYNAIVSVGGYNENGRTLVLYSAASADDVADLKVCVEQLSLEHN
jgi:hypothetical protein